MRIGLLGGTFNPVHNGHLAVAAKAREALGLDKVVFVPAYIPPHKDAAGLVSAEQRFEMLGLAVKGEAYFEVSRFEIESRTTSYSIKTLEYFKGAFPGDAELFFLIGADSMAGLSAWKESEKLFKLCEFAVFDRPGFFKSAGDPRVRKIDMAPVDISSTQIREMVRQGKSIKGLVPGAVEDYIKEHSLYKI